MKTDMKKNIIAILICIFMIAACAMVIPAVETDISAEEAEASVQITGEAAEKIPAAQPDLSNAVYITVSEGSVYAEKPVSPDQQERQEIDENALAGNGILLYDNVIELGEGTFVISGEFEGQLLVSAGKKHDTVLVLDGFSVNNPDGEALLCKKTNSFTVFLAEGSENNITNGTETEIDEETYKLTADANGGAFHSKTDTVIEGTGTLNIYGYINNGLQCSGNLRILSGNINIIAANNGIKVKNRFECEGGYVKIISGGDGIKAEEEAVEAKDAVIDEESGEVISEAVEAQEAAGEICVNAGTIEIDSFDDGMQALLDLQVNGGEISVNAYGTYRTKGYYSRTRDKTFSAKGLKSGGDLSVNGGQITINSFNDGLHCGQTLTISGGTTYIYCGDDGLHSDIKINITDGAVNIANSYEGIEANQIIIDGGTISVAASDDGMNGNGGSGSFGGSRNSQKKTATDMPNLIINGGNIYVNARGDGLDSNGNLTVNGGYTVVDGPTSDFNGPLDAGSENGGSITITGGLIFAGGASGMAESFGNQSTQPSFQVRTKTKYKQGDTIRILDPEGNEIFSHTPARGGNSITFSYPEMKKDATYILEINEDQFEVKMTGISTRTNLR